MVKRRLYFAIGILFVALGAIGVVLPIMPTVPFLIVAAFCFSRSNPEWADRLYNHKSYGQSLRDWRDRGAIGRKAKLAAIAAMTAGIAFTGFTVGFPWVLISVGILVLVGPWIWTRPE